MEQAQSATRRVQLLEQAAIDVSKITETITEISEQTNLLALNATIAVVANETKEIARIIHYSISRRYYED